jgi:hypothetical protein
MGLKGDLRSLQALRRNLKALPITVSARIASQAAPVISNLAGDGFDSGRTVYGSPRPRGVDGDELTLSRTGATRAALHFIATGRDIRTARLPRYAKYLIGKYDMLPNGPLPAEWRARLTAIASGVIGEELARK